jgi:hypothetical protein
MLKILSELGTALLCSTNPLYRFAAEDNEDRFTLCDAHILVGATYDELFDETLWLEREYDYIIYDCQRQLPMEVDFLFHIVTQNERSNQFQDDLATLLKTQEKYRLYYCPDNTKSEFLVKGMTGCPPHSSHLVDTQNIEAHRRWFHMTDPRMRKMVSYMLSKVIDGSSVDAIDKRLQRGWAG